MDNSQILNDIKALDYITKELTIPSFTNNNAANQVNLVSFPSDGCCTCQRLSY
jgi:hypothetical protein